MTYGFSAIDSSGRVCNTAFPANGFAYFGDTVVTLPLGGNGQPLSCYYPFTDQIAPNGPWAIIGAGSDADSYVICEDGRVCNLGAKSYSYQTMRLMADGRCIVSWYPLGGGYRLGVLDPATFTVTSTWYPADPTISPGFGGIADSGQPIFTGYDPPSLGGIACTRQIPAANRPGLTVAQCNTGGIVQFQDGVAGVILPGVVTFEPMVSPNGKFYITRGQSQMFTGPMPATPPPLPVPVPESRYAYTPLANAATLGIYKRDHATDSHGNPFVTPADIGMYGYCYPETQGEVEMAIRANVKCMVTVDTVDWVPSGFVQGVSVRYGENPNGPSFDEQLKVMVPKCQQHGWPLAAYLDVAVASATFPASFPSWAMLELQCYAEVGEGPRSFVARIAPQIQRQIDNNPGRKFLIAFSAFDRNTPQPRQLLLDQQTAAHELCRLFPQIVGVSFFDGGRWGILP